MAFAERFESIVKDRGIPQAELARRLGMPYPTFRYKSKRITSWKITEWNKLIDTLHLTAEEQAFLASDVT